MFISVNFWEDALRQHTISRCHQLNTLQIIMFITKLNIYLCDNFVQRNTGILCPLTMSIWTSTAMQRKTSPCFLSSWRYLPPSIANSLNRLFIVSCRAMRVSYASCLFTGSLSRVTAHSHIGILRQPSNTCASRVCRKLLAIRISGHSPHKKGPLIWTI